MKKRVLRILAVAVGLGSFGTAVAAQQVDAGRPWFDAKLGIVFSSRLVQDAVASNAIGTRIPVGFSSPVDVRLQPAPVITLSAGYPLRGRSAVEVSASYGLGGIVAQDGESEWDVQDVGLATAVVGLRQGVRPWLDLHGGFGVTKYVSESRGIFSAGSDIQPVAEVGASTRFDLPVPVLLEGRLQAHTFGTEALRRDGASNGRVLRLVIQGGVRAGGAR